MSLQIVQQAKADLLAAGVDIAGPNAIRLTNLVASRLGMGLLRKDGGTRVILHSDGSPSQWGQDVGGSGYAVDYIIDPATHGGYDILGDGGGANNPQWPSPEMAFLDRNTQNYAPPIDPATYLHRPQPIVDPPPDSPQPIDPSAARFDALDEAILALRAEMNAKFEAVNQHLDSIVKDAEKTGKTFLPFISKLFGG